MTSEARAKGRGAAWDDTIDSHRRAVREAALDAVRRLVSLTLAALRPRA